MKSINALAKEYRPTMDKEVLHSWAQDVVSSLAHLPGEPVGETEVKNEAELPKLPPYSQSAFPHGFHELWTEKQMKQYARDTAAFWRKDVVEQAAKIADRYKTDPWVARDIRALGESSPIPDSRDAEIARLREALEPFALMSTEGVVTAQEGYVAPITCAEYFHRARAALSPVGVSGEENRKRDENNVGIGMAIAAAIIMRVWGHDTEAREIISAAGLSSEARLREIGVEDYDLDALRPILDETRAALSSNRKESDL